MEPFGNVKVPFAEPAWYNGLSSPYYGPEHRAVRAVARAYHDSLSEHAEDWEAASQVPREALQRHAAEG